MDNVAEPVSGFARLAATLRARRASKGGNTVIAFVEDPDGYKIELIQVASREI